MHQHILGEDPVTARESCGAQPQADGVLHPQLQSRVATQRGQCARPAPSASPSRPPSAQAPGASRWVEELGFTLGDPEVGRALRLVPSPTSSSPPSPSGLPVAVSPSARAISASVLSKRSTGAPRRGPTFPRSPPGGQGQSLRLSPWSPDRGRGPRPRRAGACVGAGSTAGPAGGFGAPAAGDWSGCVAPPPAPPWFPPLQWVPPQPWGSRPEDLDLIT